MQTNLGWGISNEDIIAFSKTKLVWTVIDLLPKTRNKVKGSEYLQVGYWKQPTSKKELTPKKEVDDQWMQFYGGRKT